MAFDEETQFDIRGLDDGDPVEVFLDEDGRWTRGRFEITSAGELCIATSFGERIPLDEALRAGVRRVLH